MKVPVSWLKEYVEIDVPLTELAHRLTMAGLEVEEIRFVGLPLPAEGEDDSGMREFKIEGLSWGPEEIVVGAILEVMPHPNADRLVLCRLDDGTRQHIVLTGAPNLFSYKGQGTLENPLKVAYAKEGARIYDGHQAGQVATTLKKAKIRGIESYSMVCSEKELGISEEHEGVIILDADAPIGTPLVDYMGDAVLDISLTPNVARDANILGVAREVAALTGKELRQPDYRVVSHGPAIEGKVDVIIQEPELNPRFVLGLIQDVKISPSPYWVQRRLRLAGMRPINNVVDATNYAMLEIGQPLHAFDYDVLRHRAGGNTPTIITRRSLPEERLTTLDDVERKLDDFTVLVCDTAGALSIAGVMGGAESEISDKTSNILLEAAAWNFINIRQTIAAQRLTSEASYRFSRGVHPAMAERGLRRCLEWMRQWGGGLVSQGVVDNYPLPPHDPVVEITTGDVRRWLGISLTPDEIAQILSRLEFKVEIEGEMIRLKTPDHRLDIGEGVIGMADIMEEIARIYGYERIPETRLTDELPPQLGNPELEKEEEIRDLLAILGLQEVVTYRMTSPEDEARLLPASPEQSEEAYVRLLNPLSSDRRVMRKSLLASVLDVIEKNARIKERLAFFEIGPVFIPTTTAELPEEEGRLAIAMIGNRQPRSWQTSDYAPMDFYDLKGILERLLEGLHLNNARYEPGEHPSFHPGKCARIIIGDCPAGTFGEIHPLVREHYDLPITYQGMPLLAAELDFQTLMALIPDGFVIKPVPAYPPVLEDLAFIVDEGLPAEEVENLIRQAGGKTLSAVRLFDVYQGDQIGIGKKSLAYNLTYQDPERTLTDQDVMQIRQRIVRRLEQDLGAKLRGE